MRRRNILLFVFMMVLVISACQLPVINNEANMAVPRPTIGAGQIDQALTPQFNNNVIPEVYENEKNYQVKDSLPDFNLPVDEAGKNCFLTASHGLSCMETEGWFVYSQRVETLEKDFIYSGAVCPNQDLVLAQNGQLTFISASDEIKTIKYPEKFLYSTENLICLDDGEVWMTHFEGITHYKDKVWETYYLNDILSITPEYQLVEKIIVDQTGTLWISLPNQILRFSEGLWTVFSELYGFTDVVFVENIVAGKNGKVYAVTNTGLMVFNRETWGSIPFPDYFSIYGTSLDPNGNIWIISNEAFWVYVLESDEWVQYPFARVGFFPDGSSIYDFLIDDSGRFWVITNWGVYVGHQQEWNSYFMFNASLPGFDTRQVLILNGGGAVLPPGEIQFGNLTGRLLDVSEFGLDQVSVQLCVRPILDFELENLESGETPCEGQPYHRITTTGTDGSFSFSDVYQGYYYLVAEYTSGKWAMLDGDYIFGEEFFVAANETLDINSRIIGSD